MLERDRARTGTQVGHERSGEIQRDQFVQSALRDLLGLGTWNQGAVVDDQVQHAKGPVPQHVLEGLTAHPPRNEHLEPGLGRRLGTGPHVG